MGTLAFKTRISQFKSALVDAQRVRAYLPMKDKDTPYWNTYEMLIMWKMVNVMRESHGRDLLPFSTIESVERMAAGHFDYTPKFALYCAELVDLD